MATVEQRDAALAEFANKVKAEYFEEGATIDYDKLRRPGIFSRFLWMGEHAHRAYMYAQVAKESTYAGRKVTATEVDALTEHMDWAWRTRAMAQPLSLLLAGYMTWRSRKVWKFPFVTARPTFNPNVFPSERMPFLVGPAAWATWHFVRYICYAPPSWFVTQWAVSEMAVGGYEKSKREDPRLRELMQQIKVARQAELAKRFAGARPGGQREGAQGQPSQSDMRYPRQQQQQQQQSQQQSTYRDDASPTNSSGAGSETWGNAETYAENTSYSSPSASPSARPPATSYGQQAPPSSLPSTPSYSQPSQGSQASSEGNSGWAQTSSAFDNNSSSGSNDDFDDMSPVSPAARRQEAASASRSGGSAWDRIRKQQGGQSQSHSQQQQQQQQYPAETSSWGSSSSDNSAANTSGSVGGGGWGAVRGRNNTNNSNNSSASSGESYTYSAADEERESRMYEKEKAQKEFDAMVERERNGQGASGGSNGGASRGEKGWWN